MGKGGSLPLVVVALAVCLAALGGGCGSSDAEESGGGREQAALKTAEQAASEKYRWYLERKAALLVDWTRQLWGQIVAGELAKAQSRYATSRVQYGLLLPVPHLAPALDRRINGQLEEQDGPFIGFHRIERSLFRDESVDGLKPVAKELVENAQRLHGLARTNPLHPLEIAVSTRDLLEETVEKKLTGKEALYSETDLVDVSASVEGAEAAFQMLRPALTAADPDLVLETEARFADVYEPLSEIGIPGRQPQALEPAAGASFVLYEEVEPEQIEAVGKQLRRLIQVFDEVSDRLRDS